MNSRFGRWTSQSFVASLRTLTGRAVKLGTVTTAWAIFVPAFASTWPSKSAGKEIRKLRPVAGAPMRQRKAFAFLSSDLISTMLVGLDL